MYDRHLLKALRAVVELGTITAAANHRQVTSSAVSQQLAKLQRQAGVELLVRRGRYLHPTEAARILAQAAVEMEVVDARTRARLEELQGTPSGHVTVGAFPSACRGLVGPLLSELASKFPRISVAVRETRSEEGVEQVLNGMVDIAVIHDWEQVPLAIPSSLSTYGLGTDDVDLIVPRDHPAAQRESISIGELPGERWITDTRQAHAHWLQHSLDTARIPYQMVARVNEHESQISLTAHGFGLSLVPRLGRPSLPLEVVATVINESVPRRRLMRAERKDHIDRPAVTAVRQTLDDVAKMILSELGMDVSCVGAAAAL